jgi:CheY-like chemotaxis protein
MLASIAMAADPGTKFQERFLATAKERISRSLALLSRPGGNPHLVGELHTLGGEAAMVGFRQLAETAWEGEKVARDLASKGEEARVQVARLLRKLSYLVQELAGKASEMVAGPAASTGKAQRILIVDDSKIAVQALADVFELRGYHVRTATNMEQVMQACAAFSPSVLVADVQMPDLDVRELCRRFRQETQDQPSAILLMSGRSQDELRELLESIRPEGFVAKQAGAAVVVSRVAAVLEGLAA